MMPLDQSRDSGPVKNAMPPTAFRYAMLHCTICYPIATEDEL
jgi:hypothetical protein